MVFNALSCGFQGITIQLLDVLSNVFMWLLRCSVWLLGHFYVVARVF